MSGGGAALFKEQNPGYSLSKYDFHNIGRWKSVMVWIKEISGDSLKNSCWCSPGWKRLQNSFQEIWIPPVCYQADYV